MKKILIVLAVLAVLAIGGLTYLFLNLNGIVKSGVETVGPKVTKTEVKLDSVSLMPFSGSGALKGLFVGNPEGFKTPSAIKMGNMEIKVSLASLKSDTIVVEKMVINKPEITFEGTLSGSNLKKLLANVQSVAGGSSSESGSEKKIVIKDLVITGGNINFSFTGLAGKTIPAPLPDIHLTDIGTENKGATIAQATQKIMAEVLGNVDKIAVRVFADAGKLAKDALKGATGELDKTTKGIKGIFGK